MPLYSSYWERRAKQIDALTEGEKQATIKRLERIFADSQTSMERTVEAFYRKYAVDGSINAVTARRLLTPDELFAFKKRIAILRKSASSDAERRELEMLIERVRISRQESLLAELQYYGNNLASSTERELSIGLEDIYKNVESRQQYNIEQYIHRAVSYTKISPTQLQAVIHNTYATEDFSRTVWSRRDDLILHLNQLIPQQFILGRSVDDLSRELATSLNTPLNSAKTVIRTVGAEVASRADKRLYEEVGVELLQFYATLDNRTSEICIDMDQQLIKVSEAKPGVNVPPLHPNCRSTTVPYVDVSDLTPLRLAKDENGKYITVPDMSYKEWRKRSEAA